MQASWTAAALGRVKKMPALGTLTIGEKPKPTRSSWEQMYASAAAWAATAGEIRTEGDAA